MPKIAIRVIIDSVRKTVIVKGDNKGVSVSEEIKEAVLKKLHAPIKKETKKA